MQIASRLAIFCALLVSSSPALAVMTALVAEGSVVLHSTLGGVTGMSQPVPAVKPGETFGITGDCIMHAGAAEDIRVVFSLANAEGGYKSILATEQAQDGGVLQVRAPDMPEVANHTVQVQLFVVGRDAPMICHAGTIHIG